MSLDMKLFQVFALISTCYFGGKAALSSYNLEFLQRTRADWQTMWHTDCHRRCRSELMFHIELACAVDIYKIHKRSSGPGIANSTYSNYLRKFIDASSPRRIPNSLSKTETFSFLRDRGRRHRRGIMEECCYSKACSWEEYAETCPLYGRAPATSMNDCK